MNHDWGTFDKIPNLVGGRIWERWTVMRLWWCHPGEQSSSGDRFDDITPPPRSSTASRKLTCNSTDSSEYSPLLPHENIITAVIAGRPAVKFQLKIHEAIRLLTTTYGRVTLTLTGGHTGRFYIPREGGYTCMTEPRRRQQLVPLYSPHIIVSGSCYCNVRYTGV